MILVWDWFRRKAKLQALALFLAMVAWFLVHSGQTVKQKRLFGVDFYNLSSELILTESSTDNIEFTLTGSFHRLRGIESDLRIYPVDLGSFGEGRHSIEVNPGVLRLPLDIEISQANPSRLDFKLEFRETKELPVEIRLQGEPAESSRVASVSARPDPVKISGPSSQLRGMDRLVIPVSVEGVESSFSTTELLSFDSPLIEGPSSLQVEVLLISADLREESFTVPVVGDDPARQLRIEPPEARIVVEGPVELLETGSDFRVSVSVGSLPRNRRLRIRGSLQAPEGVRLLELEPDSFIVEALD